MQELRPAITRKRLPRYAENGAFEGKDHVRGVFDAGRFQTLESLERADLRELSGGSNADVG